MCALTKGVGRADEAGAVFCSGGGTVSWLSRTATMAEEALTGHGGGRGEEAEVLGDSAEGDGTHASRIGARSIYSPAAPWL